uniref:Serine--tRNA ligase n=1 Tax=uncultured Actinomycetes bacterium TaxID=152507 RepID=A0A871XZ10_9ACTN|nr:Serine--tRNA ligase [uncultured Actinomycetes bacterium]
MIDLQIIRQDPEAVRQSQIARGENPVAVDAVLEADTARRAAVSEFETLRAEQKALGKQIGPLQGKAKGGDQAAAAELEKLLATTSALSDQVAAAEIIVREKDLALDEAVKVLSNIVESAAPVGGEEDFTVLETRGTIRDFDAEGFTPRDHVEIGEILSAIDIERGAKVSGSRFYYLTGHGAMLELALINLAMSLAQKNGFTPVIPPALVKPAAMEGTGFLGQAAENVYRLEADDMYLVGTAEVPLAALHMDEILDAKKLPMRYAGYSPCFRREAGSHGKDTRGIFRVHWFDKVEMFSYCATEDAVEEHQRLLSFEKEMLDALELPYRVIDVATGDLGSSAARKFDCEAWFPTQQRYRELTSTSNCTTFQSRRLKIRTKTAEGTAPVATLNGTLVAITRTIAAIFENHQQADGSVRIPEALRPFLGGQEFLKPLA